MDGENAKNRFYASSSSSCSSIVVICGCAILFWCRPFKLILFTLFTLLIVFTPIPVCRDRTAQVCSLAQVTIGMLTLY